MKKYIKIVCILILIVSIFGFFNYVNADNFDTNGFEDKGNNSVDNAVKDFTGTIIAVIRVVAAGVAVIVLLVIAIKYMSASPSGKADIKKHAIAYATGAILLLGSSQILKMLYDLSKNIKE